LQKAAADPSRADRDRGNNRAWSRAVRKTGFHNRKQAAIWTLPNNLVVLPTDAALPDLWESPAKPLLYPPSTPASSGKRENGLGVAPVAGKNVGVRLVAPDAGRATRIGLNAANH